MRTRRIERLLKLIQALQTGCPKTAENLAKEAAVSRRTVFRDLGLLSRAGIRYSFNRHSGGYTVQEAALLPPVMLTHAEALALLLSARHMVGHRGIADAAVAASATMKLESALPAAIRDHLGTLLERIEVRGGPVSDPGSVAETLSILQGAIIRQHKTRVGYDSYYERRIIDVILHAYRIAYIHRGWYLIAFTEQARRVQTYKVERILYIKVLDDVYTVDPSFNLDNYFGNAWLMVRGDQPYHVTVRFLPKVAANVDEIHWHKTQRTTYEDGGSLIFEADVDGIEEISWWILGYGDQAQVLDPPELRDLVAGRVRRMYEHYGFDGRPTQ